MRYFLFIIFIFLKLSVGAQITDTSYFDSNWETVKKGKKFTYYIVFEKSGAKFLQTSYYRNGRKYGSGEFKDDKYEIRDGIFCWNTEAGDTIVIEKFENNVLEYSISYEGRNPERKRIYLNDSTYYEYGISGRKYIVSKNLMSGEMVYRFYGKDSVADMNYLRFAFRKKGTGTNYHIPKYKMLPWVIGEDVGMTYSLGYEFNFHRVHGIELVATYFDWDIDQEDVSGNPLPPIYNVRRSIQLDYRYYFTPIKKKRDEWKFFISPFVRFMKWKDYYSEGAVTDYFRNESWNYTSGVVLGFCLDMGMDDGMYTEFFIGPQYIHRKTTEGINQTFISVEQTYLTQKYGIRFGMNFCGLMSREK